jgi:hypothetical protein
MQRRLHIVKFPTTPGNLCVCVCVCVGGGGSFNALHSNNYVISCIISLKLNLYCHYHNGKWTRIVNKKKEGIGVFRKSFQCYVQFQSWVRDQIGNLEIHSEALANLMRVGTKYSSLLIYFNLA